MNQTRIVLRQVVSGNGVSSWHWKRGRRLPGMAREDLIYEFGKRR